MAKTSPFSNSIRRLRFEREEMTQQALAKSVGVTRQTIIALEQNRYVPSLLLAMRIANVFGVDVTEVFELPSEERAAPAPSAPVD